jgi:hypothetical protein
MRTLISSFALAITATGCGNDCFVHPCPLPIAIQLSVASTTGNPVSGVVVTVTSSATTNVISCVSSGPTSCYVGGDPGMYQIDVSAPGFRSVQKTVQVSGSNPTACSCSSPDTQNVTVTLTPASAAVQMDARNRRGRA